MKEKQIVAMVCLVILCGIARAQYIGSQVVSDPTSGSFGNVIEGGADFNGDGFDDFVVSHGADAWFYSGFDLTRFRTLLGVTPVTSNVVIDICDDMNGDNVADVLIAGSALVPVNLFSGFDGSGMMSFAFGTGVLGAGFGEMACGIGDSNGDGIGDVLIAEPDIFLPSSRGRVHVFSGNAVGGGPILTVNGPSGVVHFGQRTCPLGDVDADGACDFAVAAQSPQLTYIVSALSGSIIATAPTGRFSLDRMRDINGDAIDDFVGALSGSIGVYSGSSGAVILSWANVGGVLVSETASNAGDADGDGVDDVALIAGSGSSLIVAVMSGATGAQIWSRPGGGFGRGVGNLNQDGRSDLVLGGGGSFEVWKTNGPIGSALGPCAMGTVGAAFGAPIPTLFANGSTGGLTHRVDVGIAQPFTITVAQPSTNPFPAPFAIFGYIGVPSASSAVVLPFGVGGMCFLPYDLDPNQAGLFALANSYVPVPSTLVPATLAPWTFSRPTGLPFPIQFTLQGVISQDPATVRCTNGVIVNIE